MKSIYQTTANYKPSYKLVIDHDKKTVEKGYFITRDLGIKITKKVLLSIYEDMKQAGYIEKLD